CESWAVPEMCRLDLLPSALRAVGFEQPTFEDWSWRIAPSVAHVPLFASYFAIAELVKARGLLPLWRWRHIVASLPTPVLRACRPSAEGCVTARKPATCPRRRRGCHACVCHSQSPEFARSPGRMIASRAETGIGMRLVIGLHLLLLGMVGCTAPPPPDPETL